MRKSIYLLMMAGILTSAASVFAGSFDPSDGAFVDDFEAGVNYLVDGVDGTGWDGMTLGTRGVVNIFEAAGGVLTIESLNTALDRNNRSPFLYKELDCDFDMSVDIISGTPINFCNLALLVRVVDVDGAGIGDEDFLFLRWSTNQNNRVGFRLVNNNAISGGAQTFFNEQPTALRIAREDNDFDLYAKRNSNPDPNAWEFLGTQTLPDYAGEVLQVGITQAAYSGSNTSSGLFDNFRLLGPLVQVSGGSISVFEGDATPGQITVELLTAPSENVQVTLTAQSLDDPNSAGTDVSFDALDPNTPIVLTFTPSDWAAKTVDVFAVDDTLAEGKETLELTATVATTDPNFPLCVYNDVSISVFEGAAYVISKSSLAVVEGGDSDSFDLSLFAEPSEPVAVTVSDLAGSPAQVQFSPPVVNFTAADFDMPQTVTVTAVDDTTVETDPHTTQVQLTASGGNYEGLTLDPADLIDVSIAENDCGAWGYHESDLNQDCIVNVVDLTLWLQNWLNCSLPYGLGCIDARQ